jgi:hypothetical protein
LRSHNHIYEKRKVSSTCTNKFSLSISPLPDVSKR